MYLHFGFDDKICVGFLKLLTHGIREVLGENENYVQIAIQIYVSLLTSAAVLEPLSYTAST